MSLLHPLFTLLTRMRVQDKTYDLANKRIVIKNAITFRASFVPLVLSWPRNNTDLSSPSPLNSTRNFVKFYIYSVYDNNALDGIRCNQGNVVTHKIRFCTVIHYLFINKFKIILLELILTNVKKLRCAVFARVF